MLFEGGLGVWFKARFMVMVYGAVCCVVYDIVCGVVCGMVFGVDCKAIRGVDFMAQFVVKVCGLV